MYAVKGDGAWWSILALNLPQCERWRREWDSNPRYSFPHTRFPSVRLKPLGHLSGCPLLKGRDDFCKWSGGKPSRSPKVLVQLWNFCLTKSQASRRGGAQKQKPVVSKVR